MEFARGAYRGSLRLARGVAQYRHLAGGHNRPAWIGHRTDKLTRDCGLSEAVEARCQGQQTQPKEPHFCVLHSSNTSAEIPAVRTSVLKRANRDVVLLQQVVYQVENGLILTDSEGLRHFFFGLSGPADSIAPQFVWVSEPGGPWFCPRKALNHLGFGAPMMF